MPLSLGIGLGLSTLATPAGGLPAGYGFLTLGSDPLVLGGDRLIMETA